ncbi:endo alpha-1,4 polygalactosaminidase [Microbacterium sp. KUDC0406]|uniref:endo alpha-1,4 polygalactosaminidase n=1 Tax=Microbacterium sp. KUDC0406 TaxID=2909588 RepID=UPI001F385AF1|nr:endo alpha-1,4 polygalactosaminidase [Microbacterium sp. KUDC0406]UJP10641.1 endo alpha-1,4 polygalactosaminidase [Microbacterium sp. KUDC0406]
MCSPTVRARLSCAALLAVAVALAGCTSAAPTDLLPAGGVDYQLGTPYDAPSGTAIVARDRLAPPEPDTFSICYINAFQTQPGELGDWPADTLLRSDGETVRDPDWPDEVLLDLGDAGARHLVVEHVGGWIRGCGERGFDAVELDNLDSFTRSGGAFDADAAVQTATTLVGVAHDAGLLAGQKNAAEHSSRMREEAGFDFAIAEECAAFEECSAYADVYGENVIDIEYPDTQGDFPGTCAAGILPERTVLRDRLLVAPGEKGYLLERC